MNRGYTLAVFRSPTIKGQRKRRRCENDGSPPRQGEAAARGRKTCGFATDARKDYEILKDSAGHNSPVMHGHRNRESNLHPPPQPTQVQGWIIPEKLSLFLDVFIDFC